jgi:DNA-binding GntR family transcriptional regulator
VTETSLMDALLPMAEAAQRNGRPLGLALAPLNATSLRDQAYALLKNAITDSDIYDPAHELRLDERQLMKALGVSRTPVREALFRLRNEGFLDVEAKLGWFVKPIDFGKLEQLYDLRVVLELSSVTKLCNRIEDPPELDALKDIWLVPVAERLTDARQVGANDEQFHATLVRAAGNAEMARVHWDVTERIRIIRHLDFTRPDRIEATYVEHAKILRAVMQHKLDQAQLLLKSHVEQSKAEVRKITLHTLHEAREQMRR